jgi:hypothetical protein
MLTKLIVSGFVVYIVQLFLLYASIYIFTVCNKKLAILLMIPFSFIIICPILAIKEFIETIKNLPDK